MSQRCCFQTSFALPESKFQAALQTLQFLNLFLNSRQFLIEEFFDVGAGRYMVRAEDQKLRISLNEKPNS